MENLNYTWSWISGGLLGFEIFWETKALYLALGIVEITIFFDGIPEKLQEYLDENETSEE